MLHVPAAVAWEADSSDASETSCKLVKASYQVVKTKQMAEKMGGQLDWIKGYWLLSKLQCRQQVLQRPKLDRV